MALTQRASASNVEFGVDINDLHVAVQDDPTPRTDGNLEEAHRELEERVGRALGAGAVPFVIGGGNDQSYPNAAALLAHSRGRPVACVNIDAHTDVRPLKEGRSHSGSPFRQLLEDPRFDGRNFVEFAAQGMQCSADHVRYAQSKGAAFVWLREVQASGDAGAAFARTLARFPSDARVFVSFDLDAVRGADAPGVSCPGAVGLSSDDALSICRVAGADPRVALVDLSEFNPDVEAYRTGKLVAAMFYHFLLGFASRTKSL